MKMKKRFLGILLSLVLVLGLMPGMSITAFAASYETVEITSSVYSSSAVSGLVASMDGFVSLSFEEAKAWDPPIKTGYIRLIRGYDGEYIRITIFNDGAYVNDVGITLDMAKAVTVNYYYAKQTTVAVESVTLDQTTATLTAGGDRVKLTATVSPENATDKTVFWSAPAYVSLFSDSGCTSPISSGAATSILTVYAKGTSVGDGSSIFVTSVSNTGKSAKCTVTVNAPTPAVTVTPEGAGTVATTWGDTDYTKNDLILLATANSGYEFDHWSYSKYDRYYGEWKEKTSTSNPNTLYYYKDEFGDYKDFTAHFKSTLIPVTITQADKEVTYSADGIAIPVDGMFTITEGAGAATYSVENGTGEGTYDAQSGKLTITKCGTFTVKVSTAVTSTHAAGAETTATLTVNKANAVPATVTANNRTYDGTEKPLVTVSGEPTGGTMQYALGTDATTAPTTGYTTSIPAKTDAGTYYVWYKAVGTDGHADSAAACVTVTISEPSSGGGGGGYTIEPTTETAPSTPTETYTIPVENEYSVNVQADIQNGNAKVTEITEEDIHKVTEGSSGEDSQGKTSENNTILIDLSGSTQEVKSVELSKTTMERLAETATSTENKIETVTVQLTNVTVELDAKTLSAVAQQAEGNSINLVVEDTNASTLNSDQQQALSEFTSASTFEAYFESAGSRIHDFKGGEATVSMKFTPAQGLSITHYHVYYVATSGKLERFVTRFIETLITTGKSDKKGAAEGEGILQFTTTHFSDYAIVYDETMENATGREEADDTSSGEDKTKTANGKSSYENGLSINKGLKVSQKGETIQISWGKVKGADGYDVYVQYCGKAFSSKPAMSVNREVTSVTIKKINGKKLNLKKNYKIFVVAYKNVEGKKKRLAKSIVAHIVGAKNTRYSNPKELTITSDTDVTLEKGKTSKIKARVILANAKRKSLSDAHAPMFRYASSDKKIATVDKKGKITAKKQGSCLIWVYAKNGYAKKVKVAVK